MCLWFANGGARGCDGMKLRGMVVGGGTNCCVVHRNVASIVLSSVAWDCEFQLAFVLLLVQLCDSDVVTVTDHNHVNM
jgi:hypothetical protein